MSEKITFKELVELIAKQSKQSESSANSFIHELVQIIESGLKQSGSVSISGFGKFELRWMKERPGINPQTGEEITIPGQNKVSFKPFKALRETVNKPFANLEPEVLSDEPESKESEPEDTEEADKEEPDDDPFGLAGVFGSDDPFSPPEKEKEPLDSDDPFETDEEDIFGAEDPFETDEGEDIFDSEDPFGEPEQIEQPATSGKESQSVDDLIFERENPHFGKKQAEELEEDDDVLVAEKEEEPEEKIVKKEETKVEKQTEQKPKVLPNIPDESKMAKKVQDSGSFKWSYAAAVIIVMIALILLFWMMQRDSEPTEQIATTGEQTEQVDEQPSTADANADQETVGEEPQPTVDEESPPPEAGGTPPQNELETESFNVQSGQSLWDIAEAELGNPYLWPVIYHLNQDVLDNPNQLLANTDIEIPTFSDPDNLSEFEREQVAMGYFSLYQWNRENNPDEARYFLWAVGVFSQDMLDQPPSEVDTQDLEFARNR
ncbi:MAG: HU family DNA-binding protein [Balneolaceae bacterium]|nr:HU family DNA-binding protein [Balneolaceae bacterium]